MFIIQILIEIALKFEINAKYGKLKYCVHYSSGVFDPLTADGTIMVDGVLAACFASFNHDLAHLMMTPMQWYPEIIEWIVCTNNGILAYVGIAKEFGRWMLPFELFDGKSNQ